MKNIMIAATLMLTSHGTWAADSSALEFRGLSKDGRYVAFEQYGVQDGSGFTYSSIDFIDVDNNRLAAKKIHVVDEDPIFEVGYGLWRPRKQANEKAEATFKKLGIQKSENNSISLRKVISRSPFEDATSLKEVSFSNRGLFWEAGHSLNKVTLKLSTLSLPCPNANGFCGAIGGENNQALGIKLDLESTSDREAGFNYTKNLQTDSRVPGSRSYAHDYFIKDVYVYDPMVESIDNPVQPDNAKIIVVLGMKAQGFEGSNMDYMFVTGKMK
jgi:hypothetical protein